MRTPVALIVLAMWSGSVGGLQEELKHLPECASSNAEIPDSWVKVQAGESLVAFRVPREAIHTTEVQSVHGAELWKTESLEVRVTLGHWSLESFATAETTLRCRLQLVGGDAALIRYKAEGGVNYAVWLPESGPIYDAAIGIVATGEGAESLASEALLGINRVQSDP